MLINQLNEQGNKEGYWEEYSNHIVSSFGKGYYINGLREGLWGTYFNSGQLSYIKNYHNDLLEGYSISYYPEGKLQYKKFYLNGKKHGFHKQDLLKEDCYEIKFYVN